MAESPNEYLRNQRENIVDAWQDPRSARIRQLARDFDRINRMILEDISSTPSQEELLAMKIDKKDIAVEVVKTKLLPAIAKELPRTIYTNLALYLVRSTVAPNLNRRQRFALSVVLSLGIKTIHHLAEDVRVIAGRID